MATWSSRACRRASMARSFASVLSLIASSLLWRKHTPVEKMRWTALAGPERLLDHPGGHGLVGGLVDEDERARSPVDVVGVGENGLGQADGHVRDVVHGQRGGRGLALESVDVDGVGDPGQL